MIDVLSPWRQSKGYSVDEPMLVLLDGLLSHVTDEIKFICSVHNIRLRLLPPHCSHALQPLDVSVFRSYSQRMKMLRGHPMVKLAGNLKGLSDAWLKRRRAIAAAILAFQQAAVSPIILHSFSKIGIYPISLARMVNGTPYVMNISADQKKQLLDDELSVDTLFADDLPNPSVRIDQHIKHF